VTDRPTQLALRELRAEFRNPKLLATLLGIGILLGVSGPFDTIDLLGFIPRLAYWVVVVFATYAVGAAINGYLRFRWAVPNAGFAKRVLLNGVGTSLGVMVVLTAINTAVFGPIINSVTEALGTFAVVLLISVIVSALIDMGIVQAGQDTNATPPLLDRLPYEKRDALVAISVQDHYVQVTTTKGTEMVLMRLSDAIRETAPARGLQVHRSHWIALDEVTAVNRAGDRAIITMSNGGEIPASRSYIPALRDAGLLPKVRNG